MILVYRKALTLEAKNEELIARLILADDGLSKNRKVYMNYSENQQKSSFWLSFQIYGDGLELLDYGLPTPNHYQRANNASYGVYWLLDGYFHTKAGKEYLNDVIARLSIATKIQRRLGAPVDREINPVVHRLSEFSGLPSLPRRSAQQLNHAKYDDAVFWAIKLESIARIRRDGWIDRDSLEFWAFDVFVVGDHVKDRSTLRAKVRSVYDWYQSRDWKIDDRSFTMSRSEGAAKATAIRQARVKAKIQGAINVLQLYGQKITVRALAEEAGISRSSAEKYLKQLREDGGLGVTTPREEPQATEAAPQDGNEVSPLNAEKKPVLLNSRHFFIDKRKGAAAFLCNSFTK